MASSNATFSGAAPKVQWLQALVLLLVIGPQWLVGRDLFDGATVALADVLRNPDGLYFWLHSSNWWGAVLFFKLCFAVADSLGASYVVVVKLAVTGMLLGLYHEFVSLGKRLFDLDADEARLVGLLCAASPSVYIFVNSAAVPILVCVWLMFLGHRLFWHARVPVRLVGLAVLAVSFQLNSNLVMALALDMAFLYRLRPQWRQRLAWFVLLGVAAVSVYATMRLLAPPRQLFIEYNQLLNPLRADDARRMVRAVAMFLTWGIVPLTALVLVAAASALTRATPQRAASGATAGRGSASLWFGILGALFLCCAAAFPYVMVGKGPALFAYLGQGAGLTEQVLQAAYSGWLAPNWASTSARHGLLLAVPLGFLTWFLVRWMVSRLLPQRRLGVVTLFLLILPTFLFWVLPAYKNKLAMQFAETSLVKGLSALPPAPAGIVDLHYGPPSDWLIWNNAGTGILREAWGKSHYYSIFHSVAAYRDDVQWAYHVYFKNPGGMKSSVIQHMTGMDQFPGEDCQTYYEASLPQPTWWGLLVSGWSSTGVPAAQVRLVRSVCEPGQGLPNPKPDKKAIL